MGDIFVLRDAALCGDRAGSGFCSDAIDPGILVRVCVHIGYYSSKGSAKWDECRYHICVRFLRDCISDPPATLKPVLHYAFSLCSWQLSPTQMKCTCKANDSTYITLFFLSELNTLGVIFNCYAFFSPKYVWLVGIKSLLSVPNADCVAFSDPTQLLKRIV